MAVLAFSISTGWAHAFGSPGSVTAVRLPLRLQFQSKTSVSIGHASVISAPEPLGLPRFSGHGLCSSKPSELSFVGDRTEIAQCGVPTLVIVPEIDVAGEGLVRIEAR